ncbi:MAG: hypothetical protein M1840_008439 [Geoglossum simile]|nr:MAG: hypothetical protein M1840_008439 [Geoglossum simile]
MAGLEVLGALAAASQLAAQGLKIAIFVSDLYSKVSDAPESIRKQFIQVEQPIDTARLIERNPQLQTDQVASILCNCIGEAENLKQVLASISAAAGDGKVRKLWTSLDGVAKEKRILALVSNLEREKSSLMLCIGIIDSALLSTVHNELPIISGKVAAIHDAMQRSTVTSQLTAEQWRDHCLAALFLVDPLDDRAELVTLLWLSGGPGKGKTMLSIFLTEELYKTAKQSQSAKDVLVYFFCDNRDNRRNTAVAILRGLIWQLIQQDSNLLDHILPRIFENMVQDPVLDSVFCVLDGLDECDKHSLEGFSEKLRGFCSKSPPGLKVIVVSRELPNCISRAMSSFPRVRLDPDSDREIRDDLRKSIPR